MREFFAFFVVGHITSALFLLPLLGLYLSLNFKKVSLGLLLGIHKIILLSSIILPLFMILMSYNGSRAMIPVNLKNDNQIQINENTTTAGPFDVISGNKTVPAYALEGLPALQDMVYFITDLFLLFSMAGLILVIIRYALQAVRLKKIRHSSLIKKIGLNCELISSHIITMPFSLGFAGKRIFIPENMTPPEKEVIIQHEMNHFKCNHHIWSFLEIMLCHVFWFNPMVHILRKRGSFFRELECDRLTTHYFNKYEYTQLLIKTAESLSGAGDSPFLFASQRWARKQELKMRIEHLFANVCGERKILISLLSALGIIFFVCMGFFHGNLNYGWEEELAEIRADYQKRVPQTSRVEIQKVPAHFINALLTNEDKRFYKHPGVDKRSLIRAASANIKSLLSGGPFAVQGGSTITQQLAKQFLKNHNRSLKRKLKELRIARLLEANFTKDEILEMYLNMIYLGNGAFGLKAASHFYFKHDYTRLTLSESAMLVPFIKAPAKNNVLEDPVSAKKEAKESVGKDRQLIGYG